MALSVAGFLCVLIAVALLRGVELGISRRNQRRLEAQGVRKASDPYFHWMVLLHAAVLAGAALEVLWLNRPVIPVVAIVAGTLFVLPGLIAIMALSWIYVLLGKVTIVQGLFFGLKAAVLVIVVEAVMPALLGSAAARDLRWAGGG